MLKEQLKEKKPKQAQVNFKCPADVKELLQKQADKYTNGELSVWLRYAGLNHTPPKKDLVSTPKKKK